MKQSTLFLFITFFILFTACGTQSTSESQELRDEIIEAHDEAMPKMGELKSKEKKSLDKVEELEAEEVVDAAKVEEYKALAYDLNHAHEAMFVWMRQYNTDDDESSPEELKAYLEDQLVKVNEVNMVVKEALSKADSLLD